MEISKRNVVLWSRLGQRAAYGSFLRALYLGGKHDIMAVSADLGRSSGLSLFANEFPKGFINCGIGEQNMIGVSAGLAASGFKVFASTFAPFASLRAGEQLRMNMGYMQEPVNLVALGSGLSLGFLGNSHFGLEDLAVVRAIPGVEIISPADCLELYKTLQACLSSEKPRYIRLTGASGSPTTYENDYDFKIGEAIWIKSPENINIIASGTTVGHAKKAVLDLKNVGLHVGLLNVHTLRPLHQSEIMKALKESTKVFVFEEHSVVGGLASALLELAAGEGVDVSSISINGIPNEFVRNGSYRYLLSEYGLDAEGIFSKVFDFARNCEKY